MKHIVQTDFFNMMSGVRAVCLVILSFAVFMSYVLCQGESHLPYPTYDKHNLPVTRFSCRNKVHGGYYADIATHCQMYHVCARDKDGVMKSTKFLCGNGTVFDQRHLVCQDYYKVRSCHKSRKYYNNVATLLERLEARFRSEKGDQDIMDEATFDSQRF